MQLPEPSVLGKFPTRTKPFQSSQSSSQAQASRSLEHGRLYFRANAGIAAARPAPNIPQQAKTRPVTLRRRSDCFPTDEAAKYICRHPPHSSRVSKPMRVEVVPSLDSQSRAHSELRLKRSQTKLSPRFRPIVFFMSRFLLTEFDVPTTLRRKGEWRVRDPKLVDSGAGLVVQSAHPAILSLTSRPWRNSTFSK